MKVEINIKFLVILVRSKYYLVLLVFPMCMPNYIICNMEAGEMAQKKGHLLCKHEDLSPNPSTHIKNSMFVHAWNPRKGCVAGLDKQIFGLSVPLTLLKQQTWLSQGNKTESNGRRHLSSSLASIYAHRVCTFVPSHRCTHTH